MSIRTVFLARLIGLYCIIIAAAMFVQRGMFVATVNVMIADAPLVLTVGVFTLFIGLAMVLLHNYWSGGALPVVITLIGWLTLIKGALLLALPSASLAKFYVASPSYVLISGIVTFCLGVYLVIAGFRASL